jgi:hypothetical protein
MRTTIEKITSLEAFSAGIGFSWALVLLTGTVTFEQTPELYGNIAYFGEEITWGIMALIFGLLSLGLNIFVDALPSSIINALVIGFVAALLWFENPFSQIAVAYTLLSIMNFVRCMCVNYPRLMAESKGSLFKNFEH